MTYETTPAEKMVLLRAAGEDAFEARAVLLQRLRFTENENERAAILELDSDTFEVWETADNLGVAWR